MEPQMEHSQNIKTVTAVIIIILILIIGYVLFARYSGNQRSLFEDKNNLPTVVVENTSRVDGVLPAPPGLPADLPIENDNIQESVTTRYPDQNAKQLSLSYLSSKTVAEKYAEYKTYMTQAGYDVTEGDPSLPLKAIFGTKTDANLSVAISSQDGQTVVQMAYLLKSVK